MSSLIVLCVGVALIITILHRKRPQLTIAQLPALFSDEPEGVVEYRPDLARERNAHMSYQWRTLRTIITLYTQYYDGVRTDRYEVRYRDWPLLILDLEDGRPVLMIRTRPHEEKTYFLGGEIRDINAFTHHIRKCIQLYAPH